MFLFKAMDYRQQKALEELIILIKDNRKKYYDYFKEKVNYKPIVLTVHNLKTFFDEI